MDAWCWGGTAWWPDPGSGPAHGTGTCAEVMRLHAAWCGAAWCMVCGCMLQLEGLVRGGPGQLAGIAGYDVFR